MRLRVPQQDRLGARAVLDGRGAEVDDERRALVFEEGAVERGQIRCDGLGEAAQQRFRSLEGRMPEPIAAALDLEAVQAGEVGVGPEHRPLPDVLEPPAAHDRERGARARCQSPRAARGVSGASQTACGIGMELAERAVEIVRRGADAGRPRAPG